MDNLIFPHGGNIYEVKRRYRRDILDFSANINPLGLSKSIKRKLIKNLEAIRHYPDPHGRDLIKEIARYWKIKEENILLGNGSVELIYLITFALRPKRVLIPAPTFIEYELASKLIKARVQFVKLKENEGFALNMPKYIETDIVFISNPNNPTANLLSKNSDINGQLFVIDEAFMDFLPKEKKHTLIYQAKEDKRVIVLRSFTKFFAIPGLRIGYLVTHKDLVKKLRKYQAPWNINTLAQLAAKEVLLDKGYIKRTREFIKKERDFLFNEIKGFKNLEPYPSVTNFILIKINDSRFTSSAIKELLLKKGILIRDCSNFKNLDNKYFRIAVRTHEQNIRFINTLKGILCKLD